MITAKEARDQLVERHALYIANHIENIMADLQRAVAEQLARGLTEATYKLEVGAYRPAVYKAIEKLKELGYKVSHFDEHSTTVYFDWKE